VLLPFISAINKLISGAQESRAGLAVGKLRAHASKEVSDLAKDLVKKWKNEVEKAKLQSTSSNKIAHTHAQVKAPGEA
jgi:transcription elongation factor S-II